jgi:hypothetical protein
MNHYSGIIPPAGPSSALQRRSLRGIPAVFPVPLGAAKTYKSPNALHGKGMEMPYHDPRSLVSVFAIYATVHPGVHAIWNL